MLEVFGADFPRGNLYELDPRMIDKKCIYKVHLVTEYLSLLQLMGIKHRNIVTCTWDRKEILAGGAFRCDVLRRAAI